MRTITFLQPDRLVFGSGCLEDCFEYLSARSDRKLYIVGSGSLRRQIEDLSERLGRKGCAVTLDFSIRSEPTIEMFERSLNDARASAATCFVGIGGGSVIDVAKLLAAFVQNEQKVPETFGIGLLRGRRAHLVCVPTTAGTGGEVSPNAILLDKDAKLKKGVISPYLVPDAVFIDPSLTCSVPSGVTAATGLDTLTHCIEAYTNKFAHPLVDLYALEGVRLCAAYLVRAVKNGDDLDAREGMARASLYGGLCLGPVNTAAVHALAYPLGGEFHLAHGVSNAVLLSTVFRFNMEASPERHAAVSIALGAKPAANDRETALAGAERLSALVAECGVSTDLASYGLSPDAIPRMAASAATVVRLLRNNPRELTVSDMESLYRQCFATA
ncbi:iron-containing alcohol dehydrogenase [Edaphobacter sp. 12200R-103]|jgi:alcohol dehydrogenase class IV|uniref:iron-containing alcohol dehydrogenase n=1 Tax=Edaphobacter sp. 12200R-103 TaxID=2703788 RepID=UPI00138B60F4|nr:iron-containing alcohol dehydrogenase [Edaphobacter sp. 12200R-103]QHS51628.1 iron-containing alcohol dehydrogenase [Edaphobacter sp. 12200R-103]